MRARGEARTATASFSTTLALGFRSGIVIAIGVGTICYLHSRGGRWHRWIPTDVLIWVLPHTVEYHWPAEELARRVGYDRANNSYAHPYPLSSRQWTALVRCALAALESEESDSTSAELLWIVYSASPNPAPGFDVLLQRLLDTTRASWKVDAGRAAGIRWFLDESQLELLHQELADGVRRGAAVHGSLRLVEEQSSLLADSDVQQGLARIASMEITPGSICAAIDGRTSAELVAVESRLGLPRGRLPRVEWDDTNLFRATLHEIYIDEDEHLDCLIIVSPSSTWAMSEAILMTKERRGWSVLGRFDIIAESEPQILTLEVDSRRWVLIRAPYFDTRDLRDYWLRSEGGKLVFEGCVLAEGESEAGPFTCELETTLPTVSRVGRQYLATYQASESIQLEVGKAGGASDRRTVLIRQGLFQFELEPLGNRALKHAGAGPWSGAQMWWQLRADVPSLVHALQLILGEMASEGDGLVRRRLQELVEELGDAPEADALSRAIQDADG